MRGRGCSLADSHGTQKNMGVVAENCLNHRPNSQVPWNRLPFGLLPPGEFVRPIDMPSKPSVFPGGSQRMGRAGTCSQRRSQTQPHYVAYTPEG